MSSPSFNKLFILHNVQLRVVGREKKKKTSPIILQFNFLFRNRAPHTESVYTEPIGFGNIQ